MKGECKESKTEALKSPSDPGLTNACIWRQNQPTKKNEKKERNAQMGMVLKAVKGMVLKGEKGMVDAIYMCAHCMAREVGKANGFWKYNQIVERPS